MPRAATRRQLSLELPCWGGARRGAGRKPTGERARAPHVKRDEVRPGQPVHVTFRVATAPAKTWLLRSAGVRSAGSCAAAATVDR